METIWKFPVPSLKEFEIQMPKGAKILSVQMQGGDPVFWALVMQDSAETETRSFSVFGTGWDIQRAGISYIGTWQSNGLVWHLFENTGPF